MRFHRHKYIDMKEATVDADGNEATKWLLVVRWKEMVLTMHICEKCLDIKFKVIK